MRWGDAKTYAWLWKQSGEQYRRQLLYWLSWENPELHKLVLKELKHEGLSAGQGKARMARGAEQPMALGSQREDEGMEPQAQIQDLGDDLLAGGA